MSGIFNSLKNLTSGTKYSGQDTRLRFSVAPLPGDSGFTQWHDAMKMVARLPGGIPAEFRRRLWLTLAEKHLQARGVDWAQVERTIFNEWSNPDDDELGIQIVKDLHRTGCSLFCGAAGERNQALLKRVLLAYARWNKAVGYCQGFNMLAALILQVMERSEADSVKVMIYLIEGVLPESYFANNLRGLSVDMAVFRELLRMRLPSLSKHLEQLQSEAGDLATGTSYEPPLTNVFTMQWFLTLFSNCLPQVTVLRVWDLVFLEGNEVLLRAALAIWASLEDRIMAVESADEFYSIMGVLTREMLEFGLMDPNNLVKAMVTVAPFPFPELPELRDRYTYNITPWSHSVSNAARRGLRLFQSDEDEPDDEDPADDEKMAVAAAFGISAVFRSPRRRSSLPSGHAGPGPDKERLNLDISALKQQYSKLRERQRQAHIILSAACARQPGPTRQVATASTAPVVMNHLLLGRGAKLLQGVPRGRGAGPVSTAIHVPQQQRAIRQSRQPKAPESGETLHWRDAKRRPSESVVVSTKSPSPERLPRQRSSSSSSTTSSASQASSSSTELCDEPDRLSDFDTEDSLDKHSSPAHKPSEPTIPEVQVEIDELQRSPTSELSSPTEEASTHDQISQISLSPLMLSPCTTIQNSPTSTIQNSPTSVSSKTLEEIIQSPTTSSKEDEDNTLITEMPIISPTKSIISISVLDSPTRSIPIVSPIHFTCQSTPTMDLTPTTTQQSISPLPTFMDLNLSPSSLKDQITSPMLISTCSIDQATSPIDWSRTYECSEEKLALNLLQENSPDLIKSHWIESPEKGNENAEENSTQLIQLDDNSEHSQSVFSPENVHHPQDIVNSTPSPLRMVPLGSLSASLSSPSSNEDDLNLPDLMVITPPRELSPLSPLKSPTKWSSETVSWDATKFPFPKSPSKWNSSNNSKDIKKKDESPSDEYKWELPISDELNKSNENLISWDIPEIKNETESKDWDLKYSWQKDESDQWKLSDSEWKSKKDESGSQNSEDSWPPSSEIRESASDAPASPLPSLAEVETKHWHSITPACKSNSWSPSTEIHETISDASASPLPTLPQEETKNWQSIASTCEPNTWPHGTEIRELASDASASPLPTLPEEDTKHWQSIASTCESNTWAHGTEMRESASDASASPLPTLPEEDTKHWHSMGSTSDPNPAPEVSLREKSEGIESKRMDRKRWTIAEPIAWSVICDAISQQQESKQRPVSPLVEEEEEIKDITPVGALGRRNSERALQIIQENSEILQRIMRESRGKQMMDRETRASRPTSIGLGGSRGVRWGSQRELLACDVPSNSSSSPPIADSPTHTASWKPSTCFPSLGESPQTSPAPFNPFPVRAKPQTRELGVKLGLYPTRQVSK